jgi:hypothetical protein
MKQGEILFRRRADEGKLLPLPTQAAFDRRASPELPEPSGGANNASTNISAPIFCHCCR